MIKNLLKNIKRRSIAAFSEDVKLENPSPMVKEQLRRGGAVYFRDGSEDDKILFMGRFTKVLSNIKGKREWLPMSEFLKLYDPPIYKKYRLLCRK